MSLDFDDFQDEDGHIDWDAYHKAQVQEGERCMRCGNAMFLESFGRTLFGHGDAAPRPRLCVSCQHMDQDKTEVTHDKYIRCPKCKHVDCIVEWDSCDCGDEMYVEGVHSVYCSHCEHEFEISVRVSYSYTSPPLLEEGEKEADDD